MKYEIVYIDETGEYNSYESKEPTKLLAEIFFYRDHPQCKLIDIKKTNKKKQ